MTTIAYRDGVLAADMLIAYSSFTNGRRNKIRKMPNHVVAMAGEVWLREPLEEWVVDGCQKTEVPDILLDNDDKFSALILPRDNSQRVYQFDKGFLVPVFADYIAIGSGAMFAIGAMAHGASAMEAVTAACKHDKASGLPISSYKA